MTREQIEEHQRRHGFTVPPETIDAQAASRAQAGAVGVLTPEAEPSLAKENYDHHADTQLSNAQPKEQTRALERDDARETPGAGRPLVRFTLHRVRLLDVDAKWGSVKDLLDGLAIARLIPGDREDQITLEVRQEKVASFKEEKTVIVISFLDDTAVTFAKENLNL